MSKAFTREDDDAPEFPTPRRSEPALPPGVKNLLTPHGARHLREELERLAASGSESSATRLAELRATLATAEIVTSPAGPADKVHFGATVTLRDPAGEEMAYRLVGVDETDLDRNWVSWRSPIARALLNARLGARIRLRFPAGERELEIVAIGYEGAGKVKG